MYFSICSGISWTLFGQTGVESPPVSPRGLGGRRWFFSHWRGPAWAPGGLGGGRRTPLRIYVFPIYHYYPSYPLLLLSTPQALKFYMSSKCLQKAHLGFEGDFPFGQPSDNLQTLFRLFKTVSGTWVGRIELLDASQTCKKLASHILEYDLFDMMSKLTFLSSN